MSNKTSGFTRRGPDIITEEIVAVLQHNPSLAYEFKPLFSIIYASLRARNAASGGEEMLRLRAYEKLQSLVSSGVVKKTGKNYKGVSAKLAALSAQIQMLRARAA